MSEENVTWGLLRFWGNSLRESWSRGWVAIGGVSLACWLLTPGIVYLDSIPKIAKFANYWDWAKLDSTWWAPLLPFAIYILCYLGWSPYSNIRRLSVAHEYQARSLAENIANLETRISEYRELLAPRLEISCDMSIDGCSTPAGGNLHYFRVRVVNLSKYQGIDRCIAHLIEVDKNGDVVPINGARAIPFAPSHHPDSGSKTLMPHVFNFIDVVAVQATSLGQIVVTPEVGGNVAPLITNNRRPVFDEPGDYYLTISVSGSGIITQNNRLRFRWTGSRDTTTIGMV